MSLAEPQPPGSKVAFFSSPLNLCGSYSPSRAVPTKSTLLSSTVVIFRSRSGAICLCDLCWENSLWKTGHSKFLRLSSFDLQLSSSQVAQGQVVLFWFCFFFKHSPGKELCFHLPTCGSPVTGVPSTSTLNKEWLRSLWSSNKDDLAAAC